MTHKGHSLWRSLVPPRWEQKRDQIATMAFRSGGSAFLGDTVSPRSRRRSTHWPKSWCFHGRSGSHAPRIQRRGHSDPVGPCPTRVPGRIYTNQECPSLGAFDFSVPVTSEDEGPTPLPILHIIVEESGSTTGVEPESDGEDTLIRWVHVPRGYRLPAKPKKANILAEVVSAFGAANS